MAWCDALEVYAFLEARDYHYEGDKFSGGTGWFDASGSVLMMPEPDLVGGRLCFDLAQIMDLLANRWVYTGPCPFAAIDPPEV